MTLSYASTPPGLEVDVAGVGHATPFTEPAIVGSSVPLGAPSPQSLGGQNYYWVSWGDGGEQSRTVVPDAQPRTFTANFAACVAAEAACDGYDEDCNGTVDDVPAPSGAVALGLTLTDLSWSGAAGAGSYDVVRGSLSQLQATGDFAAAAEECLAADTAAASVAFSADPAPDDGFWFLARPRNCAGAGSYDSGGPGQPASRDPGIAASGLACP